MLNRVLKSCKRFGVESHIPVVQSDSDSAIQYAMNGYEKSNPRHINIRFHYVQDLIEKNEIYVKFVRGKLNIAHFLTKPLPRKELENCLRELVEDI